MVLDRRYSSIKTTELNNRSRIFLQCAVSLLMRDGTLLHSGPLAHKRLQCVCRFCQWAALCVCQPDQYSSDYSALISSHLALSQIECAHLLLSAPTTTAWDVWVESPPGSPTAPRGVSKHGQDRGVIPGSSGRLRVNSSDWVRHLRRCVQGEWEHFLLFSPRQKPSIGTFSSWTKLLSMRTHSLPAIKVKLHLEKSLSRNTMYNVVLHVGGLG